MAISQNAERCARFIHRRLIGVAVALVAMFCVTSPALSEEGSIDVQLNAAKASEQGCRVSFVLQNKLKQRIEELTFEIVLFDPAGSVSEFLLLKAGSLPANKMRVRQFDLKNHACDGISKVLVNDVKVCQGAGLTASACLDRIKLSSSTPIKLVM